MCAGFRGIEQTDFMFSSYTPHKENRSIAVLCAHSNTCCCDSASQLLTLLRIEIFLAAEAMLPSSVHPIEWNNAITQKNY